MCEIYDMLLNIIGNYTNRDIGWLLFDSTSKSLGMDSLDNVEFIMQIEDMFWVEIPDYRLSVDSTIEGIYNFIIAHLPDDLGTYKYVLVRSK